MPILVWNVIASPINVSPMTGLCWELSTVQEDVWDCLKARDSGWRTFSVGQRAKPAGGFRGWTRTGLSERPLQCSPGQSNWVSTHCVWAVCRAERLQRRVPFFANRQHGTWLTTELWTHLRWYKPGVVATSYNPSTWELKQEDHKFKAWTCNLVKPCLTTNFKKRWRCSLLFNSQYHWKGISY